MTEEFYLEVYDEDGNLTESTNYDSYELALEASKTSGGFRSQVVRIVTFG